MVHCHARSARFEHLPTTPSGRTSLGSQRASTTAAAVNTSRASQRVSDTGRRTLSSRRAEFKLARAVDAPSMLAVSWIDSMPGRFLSTGTVGCPSIVNRRMRGGGLDEVAWPKLVADNHEMMGGVDRHDMLRLQNYSLQRSVRFRKYYKLLFVGMIDLVIVNSYVTRVECAKQAVVTPISRAAFMIELRAQLI